MELLNTNPQFVRVCYSDEWEDIVSLRDLVLAGDESGPTSLSKVCPQDTSNDFEEMELWFHFEDYKNCWALVPQVAINAFHRREHTHLIILLRMSKQLKEDYRNAAGINPVVAKKRKNIIMFLSIHHGLADSKGCLLDSGTSSFCKNKTEENVVWSISAINGSVLNTNIQENSVSMQSSLKLNVKQIRIVSNNSTTVTTIGD